VTRFAVVGPSYPFRGGIAQHTTLLCHALARRHPVTLYSFLRQYPRWLFPGRTDRDVSDRPLTFPGARRCLSFHDPLSWLRVGREIRRSGCDVLVLPWWVTFWAAHDLLLLGAARGRNRPRVLFLCHNVLEHEPGRVKALLTRLVLRRGDAFVVHARTEEERLREIVGEERPVLRAFLPPSFPRERTGDGRLPPELGTPADGETVLLFFGFVRPYKGLDVLLRALPAVLARRPVTLWIVGEFWRDRDRYDALLAERGLERHVRIVDRYVTDGEAAACFGRATAVVQPYRSATGSGILPVAFDRGVPIVASKVGSLSDIVEDGVTGRLVPPEDPAALAEAILATVLPEENARLREGVRAAADRWSWSRLADRLEEFVAGL